jgi:hypothetical protein
MTTNAYLVYWCSEGLESVMPIGQYEQIDADNTFRMLKDQDPVRNPINNIIQSMVMRARYNSQRHYELYAITAVDGIDESDVREMFENNPQSAADTIRRIGVKLYSDRATRVKPVIV